MVSSGAFLGSGTEALERVRHVSNPVAARLGVHARDAMQEPYPGGQRDDLVGLDNPGRRWRRFEAIAPAGRLPALEQGLERQLAAGIADRDLTSARPASEALTVVADEASTAHCLHGAIGPLT